MAINPYAFVKINSAYIFYKNGKPVVHEIIDPFIDQSEYEDVDGRQWIKFTYYDKALFDFMANDVDYIPPLSLRAHAQQNAYEMIFEKPININGFYSTRDDSNSNAADNQSKIDATKQSKEASDRALSMSGVMQTMQEGYGNVPNKAKISSLVSNTGMYGGGITNLVYPSDLIANQFSYNGCYTVFFITEQSDSTIASVKENTEETKYIESAETSDILQLAAKNPEVAEWLAKGAGIIGGASFGASAASSKIAQSFIGALGTKAGMAKLAQQGGVVVGAYAGAELGSVVADALLSKGTKQLKVAIALPTPAIVDSHRMVWESQNSMLGSGLFNAATAVAGTGSTAFLQEGNFFDSMNMILDRGQDVAKEGAQAMALNGMKTGIGTVGSRLAGKAANTRKEAIFKDVEMREFSMKFQMAARSTKDMENIESIIRVLKYHAYPELTANNFMWIYPALFDIVHYYRDDVNYHMPRHATSVLRSISIDYSNGNGSVSVHHDGSPTLVTMDLNFMEITLLNRNSIAKGY